MEGAQAISNRQSNQAAQEDRQDGYARDYRDVPDRSRRELFFSEAGGMTKTRMRVGLQQPSPPEQACRPSPAMANDLPQPLAPAG